jgi:hypothetical protein
MSKQEKIFAVLTAIGIALRLLRWDGADITYVVGVAGLSFLYGPLGFAHLNGIKARRIFSVTTYREHSASALVMGGILGFFLAITLISAWVISMHWGFIGATWLLGLLGLSGALIAVFVMRQQDKLPAYSQKWLIRGVIVFFLTLALPFCFPPHQHP